jgi:hypothetical protein
MKKKRTLVIGIATFNEIVNDTLDACKKAKRGENFGIANHIDFADEAALYNMLSPKLCYAQLTGAGVEQNMGAVRELDRSMTKSGCAGLGQNGLVRCITSSALKVPLTLHQRQTECLTLVLTGGNIGWM